MIRRVAAGALGLTLVSGALAQAAGGPGISLKLDSPVVGFGYKEHFHGRLATHDSRKIVLEVSRFPFTVGLHKDATGSTDKQGRYAAHVSPTLAERLRVRTKDDSAKSRVATVYVLESFTHKTCSFKRSDGQVVGCHSSKAHGKLTLRVSYRTRYPRSVFGQESAKPVYVYFGKRAGSTHPTKLKLHGTVSQKPIENHGVEVHAKVHLDAPAHGPWAYYYSLCTKSTEKSDGFGMPGHHGCGQPQVTYGQASSYKFS